MAETGHSATDATNSAGCPTCGRPWPPSAPPSLSAPVALAPKAPPPAPVLEQPEPRIVARTKREVAEIAGVATITVGGWIKAGKLPNTGPWSDLQIAHASGISRGGSPRGAVSEHGTASRWRFGCRCDECRRAHNAETTRSRGPNVDWATVAPVLVEALTRGSSYRQAVEGAGVTTQAITRHRKRDQEFAAAIDSALRAGRDPALAHGSHGGWRAGCRCPECRTYHDSSR